MKLNLATGRFEETDVNAEAAGIRPFNVTGTMVKAVKATGSVVFTALPTDGQIVTINDGANTAKVFEFDDGTAAVGTLTLTHATNLPARGETFALGDGTTSKTFEFCNGIAGVASTGGILTVDTQPVDGDTVTLKRADGTTLVFEFNTTGGVTGSNKAVLVGTDAATAATELIAAINATGAYAGNGSSGFTASSGGSGVVNLVRTATGAGNQTTSVAKTGTHMTATAVFSGGVTAVAAGATGDFTGGRIPVITGTGGANTLTVAQVCTNIIAAIASVTGPAFLFTATQGAGTTVTLTANTKGTAGNSFTMSESAANFTVSAATFASGAAAGNGAVTGSNVAVAIGATAALTATALYNAINSASSLDITATNAVPGTVALSNDLAGAAGNITITENASNMTATGMSGGVDTADVTLLSDATVGSNKAVVLQGFAFKVDGSTAWNEATSVALKDTGSVTFATILKAALAGNAYVIPTITNLAAGWMTRGATGKGLKLAASGNESTGSDLLVKAWGLIITP